METLPNHKKGGLNLDIQYLLFLQGIREATGGFFDEFFNALSKFAVDILPFLPYIIFWCVDKKWGYRFIAATWIGEVVNGIIKLSVCAYRPWIRSAEIEPAGDSKTAATGYSFPSGHSVVSALHYGNTAAWQWNRRRWISIVCIVLILLTGFSRNFLGVHTPQDVIVGITEGLVLVTVIGIVSKKIEGKENVQNILTVIGLLAIVATILYITLKPYPMDYNEQGKLLVDPQKMMNDCFKGCGGLLAFLIGSFIERRYIRFEIPSGSAKLPILACVGFALMLAWKDLFAPATIVSLLGSHWGNFIAMFIMVLFAIIAWPLVIRKACAEKE